MTTGQIPNWSNFKPVKFDHWSNSQVVKSAQFRYLAIFTKWPPHTVSRGWRGGGNNGRVNQRAWKLERPLLPTIQSLYERKPEIFPFKPVGDVTRRQVQLGLRVMKKKKYRVVEADVERSRSCCCLRFSYLRLGGAEPFRRAEGPGKGRSVSRAALRTCSHTHHTIFTKWSNRHWSKLTSGQI